MAKLWAGVSSGETSSIADDFNSSIGFDKRLYAHDIKGSIAHASMLAGKGIITEEERDRIQEGLTGILKDIESGALKIDPTAEDIHMFVESVLTERTGEAGKKVHTARSRNDQVALDMRMYLKDECSAVISLLSKLIGSVVDKAEEYKDAVMPGYTHLQRAQPVLYSHQLLAYAFMFERDMDRFREAAGRMDASPIGACALAGTTYDTDRVFEAGELGFSGVMRNSIDAVSDRDFVLDTAYACSVAMMHLSRLSEELILFSSWEFGFISLSDDFTTGSSIMPQKKNPDMAELARAKAGRVFGDLQGLLTMMKGLPLAYDKDMQEDKEAVFDAVDTLKMCLNVFIPMIASLTVHPDRMLSAAKEGFINATDLADYLVGKGMAFRDAYKLTGGLVADCMKRDITLEEVPLSEYRDCCSLIDEDVYDAIDLSNCVKKRQSLGGTYPESVTAQIEYFRREVL